MAVGTRTHGVLIFSGRVLKSAGDATNATGSLSTTGVGTYVRSLEHILDGSTMAAVHDDNPHPSVALLFPHGCTKAETMFNVNATASLAVRNASYISAAIVLRDGSIAVGLGDYETLCSVLLFNGSALWKSGWHINAISVLELLSQRHC